MCTTNRQILISSYLLYYSSSHPWTKFSLPSLYMYTVRTHNISFLAWKSIFCCCSGARAGVSFCLACEEVRNLVGLTPPICNRGFSVTLRLCLYAGSNSLHLSRGRFWYCSEVSGKELTSDSVVSAQFNRCCSAGF